MLFFYWLVRSRLHASPRGKEALGERYSGADVSDPYMYDKLNSTVYYSNLFNFCHVTGAHM